MKQMEEYCDFELLEEEKPQRPHFLERCSEALLNGLLHLLHRAALGLKKRLQRMLKKALAFLTTLLGHVLKKLFGGLAEAIGKASGYLLVAVLFFGLGLSFFANDFSLGRTFSWEGLKVLFETFQ